MDYPAEWMEVGVAAHHVMRVARCDWDEALRLMMCARRDGALRFRAHPRPARVHKEDVHRLWPLRRRTILSAPAEREAAALIAGAAPPPHGSPPTKTRAPASNPAPAAERQRESAFGEDRITNSAGQIAIHAGHDEWMGAGFEPFVIVDVHNFYEWSMLLGDLHPGRPLGAVGTTEEGWEHLRGKTINLFERPRAIFKALAKACESGKIKRDRVVWNEEPPADRTLWRLHRDDVLDVISELGADGKAIHMLLSEHVRPASDQEPAASDEAHANAAEDVASTSPRSRAPDSTVRAWYAEHVKKHMDGGTATSGEDDWAAARDEFGDRVRQQQIRSLRVELAPSAWRRQGRRPKYTTAAKQCCARIPSK